MDGIIGFNVTDYGISRDNILADMRDTRGKWALVRNSPQLVAHCVNNLGMNVIYRLTGDDGFDNPFDRDPADFARNRMAQVEGIPNAWIHAVNEIDASERQNDWTTAFMSACELGNRKACILNYSTHRSAADWKLSEPVVRRAINGGHAVGIHVYLNGSGQDVGAWEWRRWQDELGGLWVVTEFGYIRDVRDAYKGWRGTITEAQHASFLRQHAREFSARKMPMLLFSYEHWPLNDEGRSTGFGVFDARQVMASIAAINRENTWSMPMATFNWGATNERTVTALATGLQYVNIRIQPNTRANKVGELRVGDTKRVSANTTRTDGYDWQRIEHDGGYAYVASNLITWSALSTPTPDPVPPTDPDAIFTVGLTADEVQQLINLHRQQAIGHNAIVNIYNTALERTGSSNFVLRAQMEAQADADLASGKFTVYDDPSVFLDGLPLKREENGDE